MNDARSDIGILIADSHPDFRAGLRRVLESQPGISVLGEAVDGRQALAMARRLLPKILLLDIRIPRLPGLEVLRGLQTLPTPVHTLILTATLPKKQIVAAFQLGARGFLLKRAAAGMLLEGIRSVVAGQYWLSCQSVPDLAQATLEFKPAPGAAASRLDFSLTRAETEFIAFVEAGYTNKDIAKKLALNRPAVENRLGRIYEKLGVANRLELVLFSIDHHLTATLRKERASASLCQ